ncbi:MAG: glycosyltransferase family 2 protein [Oscillospiraceae bacterium]
MLINVLRILTEVLFAVSVPLTIYGIYFVIMAMLSFKKHKQYPNAAPKTRFALVVAARNEEAVISKLVDSLNGQDYPKELFEVIVAPNNCSDNTEKEAAAHGARIFKHSGKVRSKGEVLSQIVDKIILKENFDAMCVFDADNLAAKDFLLHMNNAIVSGAKVVQGFRDSKNPRQSAISGCYSIGYWMLNQFYNRPRAALGLSALVNGSGFAVTKEMLRRLGGWNTVTMTEDYEFSARTVISGERVEFVQDAIIYDEQPLTFKESWKQRRRWVTGSLQGLRLYGFSLLKAAITKRSFTCFDMLLTFVSPVIGLISFAFGIFGSALLGLVPMLLCAVGGVLLCAFGGAAVSAFTIKLRQRPLTGMGGAIAGFWIFLASQMLITISCIIKKQDKWEPIVHSNAIGLEDVKAA